MNEEQRLVQKRLRVLEHAQKIGNVRKTCRYFGIGRSSFYRWKRAFDRDGESNGFGGVRCTFHNVGTAEGSLCVKAYFERAGAVANFENSRYNEYSTIVSSGQICSGIVAPNDVVEREKSLSFEVSECKRAYCSSPTPAEFCSKSFGSWDVGCVFGTQVATN